MFFTSYDRRHAHQPIVNRGAKVVHRNSPGSFQAVAAIICGVSYGDLCSCFLKRLCYDFLIRLPWFLSQTFFIDYICFLRLALLAEAGMSFVLRSPKAYEVVN